MRLTVMSGSWKAARALSISLLVALDSQVITVTVVFPPDSFPEEPPQADTASSPPAASSAPAACTVLFNVASWYEMWIG